MPPAIVKRLNTTINEILSDPNFKKQYEAMGSEPDIKTPEQFAAQIAAEFDVYKKVVAQQKLTLSRGFERGHLSHLQPGGR